MDQFSILMYRKPEKGIPPFDEIAQKTYRLVERCNQLPSDYRMNYKTVRKKSEAKPLEWSYEAFTELMKRSQLKNYYREIMPELGYSFSFFSSLESEKSFAYMFNIGISSSNLVNSITIDIAKGLDFQDKGIYAMIENLFIDCVSIFQPYYACISNTRIHQGYYLNEQFMPTDIHWLNYCSEEIVKIIKEKNIKKAVQTFEKLQYKDGFLKLQEMPLLEENEVDIQYKNAVAEMLL